MSLERSQFSDNPDQVSLSPEQIAINKLEAIEQMINDIDLISISDASELSGLTTRQLDRVAKKGKLSAIRLGRDFFTTKELLSIYLDSPARKHDPRKSSRYNDTHKPLNS